MKTKRVRARELGICIGSFEPGKWNALTDVPGVRVGQVTLISGKPKGKKISGIFRTGVTAILPNDDVYMKRVPAGAFMLNGAGEMTGLAQINAWGLLETPIMLTNTLSVGAVHEGVIKYILKQHPRVADDYDVFLPVVAECDDSWLNDIKGLRVRPEHAIKALRNARGGPVAEGNVGAGTGMIAYRLKGGIGTSSRVLPKKCGDYTVGVLVMTNFGYLEDLRIDGRQIGKDLKVEANSKRTYGSIISIVATDAPLLQRQLEELAKRSALGIARAGSHAPNNSGEIALAFSTTNVQHRKNSRSLARFNCLPGDALSEIYSATIDATQEAILNAMCIAEDMIGAGSRELKALPLDQVKKILKLR